MPFVVYVLGFSLVFFTLMFFTLMLFTLMFFTTSVITEPGGTVFPPRDPPETLEGPEGKKLRC